MWAESSRALIKSKLASTLPMVLSLPFHSLLLILFPNFKPRIIISELSMWTHYTLEHMCSMGVPSKISPVPTQTEQLINFIYSYIELLCKISLEEMKWWPYFLSPPWSLSSSHIFNTSCIPDTMLSALSAFSQVTIIGMRYFCYSPPFYNSRNWVPVHEASLVAQTVKNLPAMQETQVQSLGLEDPLE